MRAKLFVGLPVAAALLLKRAFARRTAHPAAAPDVSDAPPPADAAGASPAEAISDSAARPHASTTPSHPVEVVQIEPKA